MKERLTCMGSCSDRILYIECTTSRLWTDSSPQLLPLRAHSLLLCALFLISTSIICSVTMAFSTARSSTLLALLVALAFVAVLPRINAQCNPNLYESLKNNPLLEKFAEAIDMSDLEDRIKNTDNVTVLAPTNDAFNGTNGLYQFLQLNNLTLQQVTSGNDNRVASVVLYHFLPPPTATASQLQDRQSLPTALDGRNLTVSKVTSATTTNVTFLGAASNSTVLTADQRVCNSIVHIVNRILLPASNINQIPVYNESAPAPGIASAATSISQAVGVWAFALSGALAAALMM